MKPKEYNSKSWHAILYKSSYGQNIWDGEDILPDNICEYGKKLILAMLLFVIAWPGHLINLLKRTYEVDAIWFAIHFPIVLLIGFGIFGGTEGHREFHFWAQYGMGFITTIVMIVILFCFIAVSNWWEGVKLFPKRSKEVKEKTPSPIIEWYKAFKGKYCAKINWK